MTPLPPTTRQQPAGNGARRATPASGFADLLQGATATAARGARDASEAARPPSGDRPRAAAGRAPAPRPAQPVTEDEQQPRPAVDPVAALAVLLAAASDVAPPRGTATPVTATPAVPGSEAAVDVGSPDGVTTSETSDAPAALLDEGTAGTLASTSTSTSAAPADAPLPPPVATDGSAPPASDVGADAVRAPSVDGPTARTPSVAGPEAAPAAFPQAAGDQASSPSTTVPALQEPTDGNSRTAIDAPSVVTTQAGEEVETVEAPALRQPDRPTASTSSVVAGTDRPDGAEPPPDEVVLAEPGPAETVPAEPLPAGGGSGPAAPPAPRTSEPAPQPSVDPPAAEAVQPQGEAAPGSTTAPGSAAATERAPQSQAAARVAQAVEALRDAPPPRRMVVDLGDVRLAVALRGDRVQVTPLGESAGGQLSGSWQRDLSDALANRGFSLAEDGGRGDRRGDGHGDGRRRQTPFRQGQPDRAATPYPRPRPADEDGWRL